MKKFLIIDDDKALGRTLQLQLQAEGFIVDTCITGTDGLNVLNEKKYDALFLDLTLPDMTGIEILKKVKIRHPDMPVIVVSGRQDMKATIDAIKFGAFDYIRKPLDLDHIFLSIEKLKYQQQRYVEPVKKESDTDSEFSTRELIGNSPEIHETLKQIGMLSLEFIKEKKKYVEKAYRI